MSATIRRVLMSAHATGGVWTYALELCHALDRDRIEVTLATLGAPLNAAQAAEAAGIPNLHIEEATFDGDAADEIGPWLLDLERRCAPDLVHLNDSAHGSLPFSAPVIVVGHSCVLAWRRTLHGEPPSDEWIAFSRRAAGGLRDADMVIAPTAAMLRSLGQLYELPAHTRVIPNGRHPALFPPQPKEPWVFSIGSLQDEAKNVQALALIGPRLPWRVLVANGTLRRPTPSILSMPSIPSPPAAQPAGGPGLLGNLAPTELATWLGRASIYALPARYEPFGLSVLEAALAGCALVLGDIASLRELWDGCALFVAPQDDDALTEALLRLIGDPILRRRLAIRSRQRAFDFGPDRMADRYLNAYYEAAGHRLAAGTAL